MGRGTVSDFNSKVNFIWKIAVMLRRPYRPEKYGDIILPMTAERRFDCVLAGTIVSRKFR